MQMSESGGYVPQTKEAYKLYDPIIYRYSQSYGYGNPGGFQPGTTAQPNGPQMNNDPGGMGVVPQRSLGMQSLGYPPFQPGTTAQPSGPQMNNDPGGMGLGGTPMEMQRMFYDYVMEMQKRQMPIPPYGPNRDPGWSPPPMPTPPQKMPPPSWMPKPRSGSPKAPYVR